MNTQEKAHSYEMLKVSIDTLLEAYTKQLVNFLSELKYYEKHSEIFPGMVELKREHVYTYKAKIEVLTFLIKK